MRLAKKRKKFKILYILPKILDIQTGKKAVQYFCAALLYIQKEDDRDAPGHFLYKKTLSEEINHTVPGDIRFPGMGPVSPRVLFSA